MKDTPVEQSICTDTFHNDECPKCGKRRDGRLTLASFSMAYIYCMLEIHQEVSKNSPGYNAPIFVRFGSCGGPADLKEVRFILDSGQDMIIKVNELRLWFIDSIQMLPRPT